MYPGFVYGVEQNRSSNVSGGFDQIVGNNLEHPSRGFFDEDGPEGGGAGMRRILPLGDMPPIITGHLIGQIYIKN